VASTPEPERRTYQFGDFRIDTVERLLFRGDQVIPLTPKTADTLLALVSNAGHVVEKDRLMKMVWPDSFVEEGGLARNISILRKVLEESGAGEPLIETIPRRGYRFVGAVTEGRSGESGGEGPARETELAAPQSSPAATEPCGRASPGDGQAEAPAPPNLPPLAPRRRRMGRPGWALAGLLTLAAMVLGYFRVWRPPAAHAPRIGSLVVCPLASPSRDPAREIFSDGLTYELINALSKIESLRVISQTTAMTYKGSGKPLRQIAAELNVDAAVEGSVIEAGDTVRVTIQVFDSRAERPLLAREYVRAKSEVLALESEVAADIAREVEARLTSREKRAWRGRAPWTPRPCWITTGAAPGGTNARPKAFARRSRTTSAPSPATPPGPRPTPGWRMPGRCSVPRGRMPGRPGKSCPSPRATRSKP
jgi:DNA-binding winged helix-turn-helix (wHTH) protein/TolB-like protein